MAIDRHIGDPILTIENVSLSFGGVRALTDVSFNIREHEICAIIGPNGAGKTSMLNVINGFYHPQEGTITFRGQRRHDMKSHEAAVQGIARTFQNVALFRGMTTLDNIMTGRLLKMRSNFFLDALYIGPARRSDGSRVRSGTMGSCLPATNRAGRSSCGRQGPTLIR